VSGNMKITNIMRLMSAMSVASKTPGYMGLY